MNHIGCSDKVMRVTLALFICCVVGSWNNISYAQMKGEKGEYSLDNGYINYCQYYPNNYVANPSLTNKIDEWNKVRTGAFSDNGSGVIVSGTNGFWANNIDDSFLKKLFEINNNSQRIIDVTISEDGKYWGVAYNYNGWFALAPQKVYDELNYFVNNKIGINSLTINSNGDYIIVGDNGEYRSSSKYGEFIVTAMLLYGKLISADISKNGFILCCERGVVGALVPSNIAEIALKKVNFTPKVIKISASGHYLITNGDSSYWYWM